MRKSLTYKILENNLISGELKPDSEITVKVNQTLTQDSTGTMVYLQLEAMNIKDIKTDLSVAYIDHNTLQAGFENWNYLFQTWKWYLPSTAFRTFWKTRNNPSWIR